MRARAAAGNLVFRPWFDRLAVPALARLYFPASRAWAAAVDLPFDGEEDASRLLAAFADALGMRTIPALQRPLAVAALRVALVRRQSLAAVETRWAEAFFGEATSEPAALAALEAERHRHAHRFMASRAAFLPLLRPLAVPALVVEPAPPSLVSARHSHRLAAGAGFPAPSAAECAAMRLSPPFDGPLGVVQFLDGPAAPLRESDRRAAMGASIGEDRLRARLTVPAGHAPGAPTVVFTHGIAMETEFWQGRTDAAAELCPLGLAALCPEGPGHGSRRLVGRYGGEPVLARGLDGLLSYFPRHVEELGRLIAFARARFGGPVGLAGVSLGALTAQLAAVAARDWPEQMRPDALFLLTTSGSLTAVAFDGDLTRALGVPQRLAHEGWTSAAIAPYLPLLEPQGPPPLAPERIVMVLGETDALTPFAPGRALAERWRLPDGNLFLRKAGHFSTALSASLRPEPIERLAAILRGLAG